MLNWGKVADIGPDLLISLAIAVFGVALLRSFYGAFASHWPESYFGGDGGVDPVVSRSWARYVAFRSIPVFLACYASGVAATRMSTSSGATIALLWGIYAATTSVPSIRRALRRSSPSIGLAAYRLSGLVFTGAAAVLAYFLDDAGERFVPSGPEVAFAFWIAAATLASAHWAKSLMATPAPLEQLLARAMSEVDDDLLAPLLRNTYAPPSLLLAIAYAEQLNRPLWARRLERLLVRRNGTYGIMQVASPRPITDSESVDAFIRRIRDYPRHGLETDPRARRAFFLYHNDDAKFADLAESFAHLLEQQGQVDQQAQPRTFPIERYVVVGGGLVAIAYTLRRISRAHVRG